MTKYNLRKDTDLTSITFEEIVASATTVPDKSEDKDFSGFSTPSSAHSLHLGSLFTTTELKASPSSTTYSELNAMDLDISGIKEDWDSRRIDLDAKLDNLTDLI